LPQHLLRALDSQGGLNVLVGAQEIKIPGCPDQQCRRQEPEVNFTAQGNVSHTEAMDRTVLSFTGSNKPVTLKTA
jgi:hypothetical protein